ncbi:hypothetical protein GCM10020000_52170 [Streptomyces olivoverticillatus]
MQEVAQLRRGRVRLGAPPSLCASLVPDVLRTYHERFPGIDLLVDEGGSQDLVRSLAAGGLDLALIITPLGVGAPALAATELLREDLVVVTSPAAPAPTRRRALRVADLRGLPMVMFRRGYDLRDITTAACRAAGFEPSFTVEGGEMDAVLGFVRAGLGLAVVPGMVAARSGLRVTPFEGEHMRRTVALAHRKDVAPPRAARELQRVLLEHLGGWRRGEGEGRLAVLTTPRPSHTPREGRRQAAGQACRHVCRRVAAGAVLRQAEGFVGEGRVRGQRPAEARAQQQAQLLVGRRARQDAQDQASRHVHHERAPREDRVVAGLDGAVGQVARGGAHHGACDDDEPVHAGFPR